MCDMGWELNNNFSLLCEKEVVTMNTERRFDLNDLISEEDLARVDTAAEESRKW